MFNPFSKVKNYLTVKAKNYLIRKTTERLLKKIESPLNELLKSNESKGGIMKGWRTLLVNSGLAAAAAFLQFVAGINLPDYGIDGTVAVAVMAVVNFFLRFITTTGVGRSD